MYCREKPTYHSRQPQPPSSRGSRENGLAATIFLLILPFVLGREPFLTAKVPKKNCVFHDCWLNVPVLVFLRTSSFFWSTGRGSFMSECTFYFVLFAWVHVIIGSWGLMHTCVRRSYFRNFQYSTCVEVQTIKNAHIHSHTRSWKLLVTLHIEMWQRTHKVFVNSITKNADTFVSHAL